MSRRSTTLLVIALALAAVVTWLLSGGGGERPFDAPPPDAPIGDAPPSPAPPGGEEGVVRVEVRRLAALLPRAGQQVPPCVLVEAGRAVPCTVDVVAGPPGAAEVGRHLVRFAFADGSALWRVVELGAETAVVERFASVPFEGLVVDGEGAPVADATVWAGETDPTGAPRLATTDAAGRFTVDVAATRGVPVVVRHVGHAAQWRPVDLESARGSPFLVQVAPSSIVDVTLLARVSVPERGRVAVLPASDDVELRHYPFFWSAVDGGAGALSERGTATFEGLPRGSRVGFAVRHPELAVGPPVATPALRGEREQVRLPAPETELVTGRAVTPDHEAVPEAVIEVLHEVATIRGRGWLLPSEPPLVLAVRDDGTFEVPVAPGGVQQVGVLAPGRAHVAVEARSRQPIGDVVLPEEGAGDADGAPALVIDLPELDGVWRPTLSGSGELRWENASTLVVELREPQVVAVDVLAEGPDGVVRRSWPAVAVRGATALSLSP